MACRSLQKGLRAFNAAAPPLGRRIFVRHYNEVSTASQSSANFRVDQSPIVLSLNEYEMRFEVEQSTSLPLLLSDTDDDITILRKQRLSITEYRRRRLRDEKKAIPQASVELKAKQAEEEKASRAAKRKATREAKLAQMTDKEKAERKAIISARAKAAWAGQTPEEKAKRIAKAREARKQTLAQMTDEQRAAWRANISAGKKQLNDQQQAPQAKRWSDEDKKAKWAANIKAATKARIAKMTEEEKKAWVSKLRESRKAAYKPLNDEEKAAWAARIRVGYDAMTDQDLVNRNAKISASHKARWLNMPQWDKDVILDRLAKMRMEFKNRC